MRLRDQLDVEAHVVARVGDLAHVDDEPVGVRDDGIGGADQTGGSGLVGLRDRAEALGGTLSVLSPRDEGTVLEIDIPTG